MTQNLAVQEGLTEEQLDQLIQYSQTDPEIQRYTIDQERFKDKESFFLWEKVGFKNVKNTKVELSKGRFIYTLTNKEGALLGIIWFGEKKKPGIPETHQITFAIRMYQEARGKGLAKLFMKEAFAKFKQSDNYRNIENRGFWLETPANNKKSIALFEGFGFTRIGEVRKNSILMIL